MAPGTPHSDGGRLRGPNPAPDACPLRADAVSALKPEHALIPSGDCPWFTVLDLTDFKRDLSELSDRLGHAQDCL